MGSQLSTPYHIFLFDMDGVLLEPLGYRKSLQRSVKRIGLELGVPNTQLTEDQIARFEAINITNEWDSVAICAALVLIHVWKVKPSIRLDGTHLDRTPISNQKPDFDAFLMKVTDGGQLPAETAYHYLIEHYSWLNPEQTAHLWTILGNCRDIYQSLTLPGHQETVLGSKNFHNFYHLPSQLNSESYLLKYDRPIMTTEQYSSLREWLNNPMHLAGILTNRPCRAPDGYLSAPEAELGNNLIGLADLPYIGSGILGWFAANYCQSSDHSLLKPNPVHTLSLLRRCLGYSLLDSLGFSISLWQDKGSFSDWQELAGAKVSIFEDSAKGLRSGQAAYTLLKNICVDIELTLVGVAQNPIKQEALKAVTPHLINSINEINWFSISS